MMTSKATKKKRKALPDGPSIADQTKEGEVYANMDLSDEEKEMLAKIEALKISNAKKAST